MIENRKYAIREKSHLVSQLFDFHISFPHTLYINQYSLNFFSYAESGFSLFLLRNNGFELMRNGMSTREKSWGICEVTGVCSSCAHATQGHNPQLEDPCLTQSLLTDPTEWQAPLGCQQAAVGGISQGICACVWRDTSNSLTQEAMVINFPQNVFYMN